MVIMAFMSVLKFPPNTAGGRTLSHYTDVLTDPLNWKIAWTTLWISTTAMIIMLAIAIPLAYYMVFRAGRWELFLLLSLVLADELAPVVKIYAWQVILGRNGIVNWLIPGPPKTWLLFSSFAVISSPCRGPIRDNSGRRNHSRDAPVASQLRRAGVSTVWIDDRWYRVARDLTGSSGHITSGVLVGRVGVRGP